LLLAPFTAAGVMFKIYQPRSLRRYWYTVPVVYLNRLVWRLGGAWYMWHRRNQGEMR
jgi:hypothetical protein